MYAPSQPQFYVPMENAVIARPYHYPFVFDCQYRRGQGVSKENMVLVSQRHGPEGVVGEYVYVEFGRILWDKFEEHPCKKLEACMFGEWSIDRQSGGWKVCGKIWMDLNHLNDISAHCGVTLSPVPFGMDGKPRLPDIPGLRKTVSFLLKERPEVRPEDFKRVVNETCSVFGVDKYDPSPIWQELIHSQIVTFGVGKFDIMPTQQIQELFGEQIPPYPEQ